MIETIPSGTMLHGRYRIERALGSGGFGHVYLALDGVTKQACAVKEYLVTGTSGQEQLQHEARVLSQLHHPHIPAFVDAFMEQGRYFIVLNYVEGNDLTDLIRKARQRNQFIPLAQIMQWILAICDAVMFLHSQHPIIIHRDIKPDNIRITPNGTAVLVDLGNAKAVADGARTLFFIRHQGTPGYAPPEQYPGGAGTDARSDVYALGGTLYFALTGREPADVSARNRLAQQRQPDLPSLQDQLAKNPPPNDPAAEQWKQFQLGVNKPGKPVPRHSYHLAQLATLPPEQLNQLNAIIQRAMAIKPKDRYQSVADFAADLRKVMAALPPPPQTPGHGPQSVDQYKTQPDLQKAYEQLQAEKEQQARQNNAFSASPPLAATNCPRCNAQLSPGTTRCPRCGTRFGATRAGTSNNNSVQALSNFQNRDSSDMPTIRVDPQTMKAVYGQQTPPASQQQSADAQRLVRTISALSSSTPSQQGNSRAPQSQLSQGSNMNKSKSYIPDISNNVKIAAVIGIIVVLLFILTLLLTHH
jgi:serine/threonine protein kinase